MPIAIFGACLALLSYYGGQGNENFGTETSWAAEETDAEGDSKEKSGKEGLSVRLRRSDLIKHWLIGLGAEVGYNYERMQASGNVLAEYSGQFYTVIPEVGNRRSDVKETVIPEPWKPWFLPL